MQGSLRPQLLEQVSTLNVSVGIPAHNEEGNIAQLLDALRKIPYLDEIIVISSSTDRTNLIVQEKQALDSRIVLIRQSQREGKASAINAITSSCRSDVIVFLSADTLPTASSFASIIRSFDDPRVGAVSGRPVPLNKRKSFGYVAHIMWYVHWKYLLNLSLNDELAHVSGEMCAFRNKLFTQLPTDVINDDSFMALMWARMRGFRILLNSNAVVCMKAPGNVIELINQRRRVNAGHLQIQKMTNLNPSVFTMSYYKHPRASINTIGSVFRKFGLRALLWGSVLMFIEIVAFISAFFVSENLAIWEQVSTTKNLS